MPDRLSVFMRTADGTRPLSHSNADPLVAIVVGTLSVPCEGCGAPIYARDSESYGESVEQDGVGLCLTCQAGHSL